MNIIFYTTLAICALIVFLWIRAEYRRSEAEQVSSNLSGQLGSCQHDLQVKRDEVEKLKYRVSTMQDDYRRGETRDDLLNRLEGLREHNKTQRERIKFLQKKNKELTDELFARSELNMIRFEAFVPEKGWCKTTFKLGRGPCGLTVRALAWTEKEDRFILTQKCTNGETKEFEYMKDDVRGRREFRSGRTEF